MFAIFPAICSQNLPESRRILERDKGKQTLPEVNEFSISKILIFCILVERLQSLAEKN